MNIKPCPFCRAHHGAGGPRETYEGEKIFIECNNCEARGPTVDIRNEPRDGYVVGRWNNMENMAAEAWEMIAVIEEIFPDDGSFNMTGPIHSRAMAVVAKVKGKL